MAQPHSLLVFLTALFLAFLPRPSVAETGLSSFHSAAGDRIDLVIGLHRSGKGRAGQVPVCLETPPDHGFAKGIGNHLGADGPDLAVLPGAARCLHLAPLRQTLVFWSQTETGGYLPALVTQIDLRARVGEMLFLRWSREATGPELKGPAQ